MQPFDEPVGRAISAAFSAVGVELGSDDLHRCLEELDIDSLARAEIASQVQSRLGVNIESHLSAQTTPAVLHEVATAAAAGATRG